ncbi:MAG: glycosyltransferase family 4 protein [Candidatus Solibacter usitatus]|nr:glycosyltransferase family 4 protein [Candidatus Solibacter usitatus]
MTIALDATYSLGEQLTGVGVYSREILRGLAEARPRDRFLHCYRPHRFLRSFQETWPANCRRRLLQEPWAPRGADLFHGLNQRLPRVRLRRRVTTFHDLFVLTGEYSTPEFRRRFAQQAREAAAASDRIICVSAFTASQVERLLGVSRDRLRVVHHGVRPPAARPGVEREKIILHVGAIQKRKNVARLAEAFQAVDPEWRLILAGPAGFGAGEILRGLEGQPRITVTGYVSARELADWYSRAMVLAFPSLDEGFGIPVLEAMAAGVAVVASNRAALQEVAGDAALLLDPEDTGALAAALRKLTREEDFRRDLAGRGLLRAAQFTWAEAVHKTWAVYEELL